MTATLTDDITATQRTIRVTDPGDPRPGARYQVGDELVVFEGFGFADDDAAATVPGDEGWIVMRGAEGTEAAEHDADDELVEFSVTGDFRVPAELPEVPAEPETQDIVDALVELGLVTQAEA